jgi:murein DD-endopeptidase MepM/ murein hydrolase activator NlpD
MSRHEVEQLQKALNNFTDKRLAEVRRIEEDGTAGKQTRNRVLQCKWWLGYRDEERSREWDDGFLWRLRNPLTVKEGVQGKAAIERGQERRDAQKARVRRENESDVHSPLVFTQDSWGYNPPGHDGVDLICAENAPLYAMTDGKIVRVSDDWWGAGNPGGATGDRGDGIIVLRCSVDDGPFFPGLNICYGHAEHPTVRVGEQVKAGEIIGRAGLANAWHIHLMVNDNADVRGVGDRDPRPFYRYAMEHQRG